jgi:hypothetical protein
VSSNKTAKQRLIQRYGEVDFLDQLKVTTPVGHKYKSKGQRKRMQQLTYHHIREKSKGGKATVENGALLREENHIWFHQQPPEIQAKLNNAFQELKRRKDQELEVVVEDLDVPFEVSLIDFSIDSKSKMHTYDRAKVKTETKKLIQEELEK